MPCAQAGLHTTEMDTCLLPDRKRAQLMWHSLCKGMQWCTSYQESMSGTQAHHVRRSQGAWLAGGSAQTALPRRRRALSWPWRLQSGALQDLPLQPLPACPVRHNRHLQPCHDLTCPHGRASARPKTLQLLPATNSMHPQQVCREEEAVQQAYGDNHTRKRWLQSSASRSAASPAA